MKTPILSLAVARSIPRPVCIHKKRGPRGKGRLTVNETLDMNYPEIIQMRKRKFNLREIHTVLSSYGIDVSYGAFALWYRNLWK